MATVTPFIRTQAKSRAVNVRYRLRDGRHVSLFHTSEIKINPDFWDAKKGELKAKLSEITITREQKTKLNKAIADRKALVLDAYFQIKQSNELSSKLLDETIEGLLNPDLNKGSDLKFNTIHDAYSIYIDASSVTPLTKEQCRSVNKIFKDYADEKGIVLTFDNTSSETLKDFEQWLLSRGCSLNTIAGKFKKISTFYTHVCKVAKWSEKNPFDEYKKPTEMYGTPLMLTKEERDYLRDVQIENESLSRVRDLFILQCLIGCRVGDFFKLRKENTIDGCLEYIAEKTKKETAKTLRVPISKTAKTIIDKYDSPDGSLMPFISDVKYNLYLKKLFTHVGLIRPVSWLNPKTRNQEIRQLNEIVSSHMARRTFVGIAHKAGLKNEIIASMSGHVPNSRAFERYYAIDEKQKFDAITLID